MKKILVFLMIVFSSLGMAAEQEQQVTGYGKSVQDAISDGLIRAVEQQFGAKIDATRVQSLVVTQNEEGTQFADTSSSVSSRKINGNISRYDVQSKQCNSDGCEAELLVVFRVFKAAGRGADHLRKLGVVPFPGNQNRRFTEVLNTQLLEQLVQSRRFAILDRQNTQELDKERALWSSEQTPLKEKVKLGQVLGMDYILVGQVRQAGMRRWTETVALTGESEEKAETNSEVSYQLIEVATSQIKWSATVNQNLKGPYITLAARKTADQITEQLLSNIYPMRVVGFDGSRIILNQGGKTVPQGQCYEIYALGEKVVDPYTGDFLGQSETLTATVKITRVLPKMAYATVVRGQQSAIQKMYIARRVLCPESEKGASKPVKSESQDIPEGGGVFL